MRQAKSHSRARRVAAIVPALIVLSALFACGPKEQAAPPLPTAPVAPTVQPAAPSKVESVANRAKELGEGSRARTVDNHDAGTAVSRAAVDSARLVPNLSKQQPKKPAVVGKPTRKPLGGHDADTERALLDALQNESPEDRQQLNSMLSGETLGKGTPLGVKPRK